MKISTKGRYALRMMIDIAQNSHGRWVSIKDIAQRQEVSVKYLEQIVTNLTKSGLLLSSRGPQGGYMLAQSPEKYTIGQVLRVIEGNLAPVACLEGNGAFCNRQGACPTLPFWKGLFDVINRYADSVTLQDLADTCRLERPLDFSI